METKGLTAHVIRTREEARSNRLQQDQKRDICGDNVLDTSTVCIFEDLL